MSRGGLRLRRKGGSDEGTAREYAVLSKGTQLRVKSLATDMTERRQTYLMVSLTPPLDRFSESIQCSKFRVS